MHKRFLLTWFAASGILLLVCPMSQANARAFAVSAALQRSANVAMRAGDSAPAKPSWKIVPSRNPGGPKSFKLLSAVATVSANDAWTVGFYSGPTTDRKTLIEQWNGTRWNVVPGSNPGITDNELNGVAAVSANDVWAVGFYHNAIDRNQTLIEHWNGSSWSFVTSPNVGTYDNWLNGVVAVSVSDVWAVGYSQDPTDNHSQTLIEHWDGASWSVVPSPSPGSNTNVLWGVTAASANNVWAVGCQGSSCNQTLIEQWNGSSWSLVPSPNPGSGGNGLSGVAAVSATDVWAVGYSVNNIAIYHTLIERWDGSSWSVVKSPNDGGDNFLLGVAVVSASDVWSVGEYYEGGLHNRTLIEHWDGSRWRVVPSPNRKNCDDALYGVAAISASDAWAVGLCFWSATLTEHYT